MRIFKHPNMTNFKCPICGTSTDKPVTLVPVAGIKVSESRIVKVEQVHLECIDIEMVPLSGKGHWLLAQEIIKK